MKKMIIFIMVLCCLLTGCGAGNGTRDIDVGDIDVGDIDVGDIDKGIYVKTEADSIYSVEWGYGNQSGSCLNASDHALETDGFLLLTAELVDEAEREGRSIDFTITAKGKNEEVLAEGAFTCEPGTERMNLIIRQDGTIQEE